MKFTKNILNLLKISIKSYLLSYKQLKFALHKAKRKWSDNITKIKFSHYFLLVSSNAI